MLVNRLGELSLKANFNHPDMDSSSHAFYTETAEKLLDVAKYNWLRVSYLTKRRRKEKERKRKEKKERKKEKNVKEERKRQKGKGRKEKERKGTKNKRSSIP